jgi:hypothetical protein
MIVVDGTVVTVRIALAIPGGGAGALPAGPVDDLRQVLSAEARTAFDSNAVRVDGLSFGDVSATAATVDVPVVTQGVAQLGGDGFAGGITSFAGTAADAVLAYAGECLGGPPAVVEVSATTAQLGTGALNATTADGAAPTIDSLTPMQRRVARLVAAFSLIVLIGLVLWVFGQGGLFVVGGAIVAAGVVLGLELGIEGMVPS